jgi:hypothetical protein
MTHDDGRLGNGGAMNSSIVHRWEDVVIILLGLRIPTTWIVNGEAENRGDRGKSVEPLRG